MNTRQPDSDLHDAVTRFADSISVPEMDLGAIRTRRASQSTAKGATFWSAHRRSLTALAGSLLLLAAASPVVVAQVQRVVQAFRIENGQAVPLDVRDVSLAQAHSDMPFRVVDPAGIPAGLNGTAQELLAKDPANDSLVFQFSAIKRPGNVMVAGGPPGLPILTIMESSAASASPANLFFATSIDRNGPLHAPVLPDHFTPLAGHVQRKIIAQHFDWTVGNTRISLLSPPGTFTVQQLAAIRAAMSH